MRINYSDQPVINGKSIFLAEPPPRSNDVLSWRPEACEYLNELNFDGIVYVPELSNHKALFNYDNQVAWEWEALEKADVIIFWVPRKKPEMMALTTNIEFGYYVREDRILYGRPETSESNVYLDRLYKRHHSNGVIYNDLKEICNAAINLINNK